MLTAILGPVAAVLVFSAVRIHLYTGHYGVISSNGPLNFVFGRCHATSITSTAPDRKGSYSSPPLAALARWGKEHPDALFKLDPAIDTRLHVEGHMWDSEPMYALAKQCMARTGMARQAKYAASHVALLWRYNLPWPDTDDKRFSRYMDWSQDAHNLVILPVLALPLGAAG